MCVSFADQESMQKMMLGIDGSQKPVSKRTEEREAFFLEFARAIRHDFQDVPLLVTGGFRSRRVMEEAVSRGDCDMIGVARPSVLNPSLPKSLILNTEVKEENAKIYTQKILPPWIVRKIGVRAIGAGTESVSEQSP